jgi:hypothetical protein
LKLFFGKGDPKAIKSSDNKMAVLLNFLDPIITRKRRQHYEIKQKFYHLTNSMRYEKN